MHRETKMKLLFGMPFVVIFGCYFGLLAKANDNTLYLQDIAGDRAFLKPFTVQMELYGNTFHENILIDADGVTKEPFETEEEEVRMDAVGTWKDSTVYVYDDMFLVPTEDAIVTEEVYEGEYQTKLTKYDKAQVNIDFWVESKISKDMMRIRPDVVFAKENLFEERETKIGNTKTELGINMTYFLDKVSTKTVLIGDDLYTMFMTGNIGKGTTGVYRTNMQDLCNTKTSASLALVSTPFLEFAVDDKKCMLGLEAVGENLVLFRKDDTVVWMELYDTAGRLLQSQHWDTENSIDDFKIEKTVWKEGIGFQIHTFKQEDASAYENTKEILVWVEENTIQEPKIKQHEHTVIEKKAVYKNYCLAISTECDVPEVWKPFYIQYNNPPLAYILTVYDENDIVYQGKLVTDWKDDYYKCHGNFYTLDFGRKITEQKENKIPIELISNQGVRLVWTLEILGDLQR